MNTASTNICFINIPLEISSNTFLSLVNTLYLFTHNINVNKHQNNNFLSIYEKICISTLTDLNIIVYSIRNIYEIKNSLMKCSSQMSSHLSYYDKSQPCITRKMFNVCFLYLVAMDTGFCSQRTEPRFVSQSILWDREQILQNKNNIWTPDGHVRTKTCVWPHVYTAYRALVCFHKNVQCNNSYNWRPDFRHNKTKQFQNCGRVPWVIYLSESNGKIWGHIILQTIDHSY